MKLSSAMIDSSHKLSRFYTSPPSNCHSKLITALFGKEFEQTEFGEPEFPQTSTQNQQSREPKQNTGFQSPSSQSIFGSNSPFPNVGPQPQKFGGSFSNINGVSSANNIQNSPSSPVKLGAAFDIPTTQAQNNFEIGKVSQPTQPNFFNGVNNLGQSFPALPQFSNDNRQNFNPNPGPGQSFGSAFGSPSTQIVGPANRPNLASADPDVEIISQVAQR